MKQSIVVKIALHREAYINYRHTEPRYLYLGEVNYKELKEYYKKELVYCSDSNDETFMGMHIFVVANDAEHLTVL
jgi:hypothetical protein